jgi:hypothetical protein
VNLRRDHIEVGLNYARDSNIYKVVV